MTKPIIAIICLIVSLVIHTTALPVKAGGIPVLDAANLQQNTVDAFESVTQTIRQLEEYTLQLQQYEDQLRNAAAPWAYVWSKAQKTIGDVVAFQNRVNGYVEFGKNIDGYMEKYGSVSMYQGSPYFKRLEGGKKEQLEELLESDRIGSEVQKQVNDAALLTILQQQKALQKDASTLEELQRNAQTAEGRLEALQYANQLAAQQANQILQLRALLIAQKQAEIARAHAIAAREARQQAAREFMLESRYTKSEPIKWTLE